MCSTMFFKKIRDMRQYQELLQLCSDTKAILIGDGVINQVADIFKSLFKHQRAILVTDEMGWKIAGEKTHQILKAQGIDQDDPFVFHEKGLFAEWSYMEKLEQQLKTTAAIPVAVGSGTINDLTKLSSNRQKRRYICVGTVASMDGYTSYGASVIKDGLKHTYDCRGPQAWIGDTKIIGNAPSTMTAAGYADLMAKIPAGADWLLSNQLGIDPIDPTVWHMMQDNIPTALSHPKAIANKEPSAVGQLVEGLVMSGCAMQIQRSSRAASGADHLFSHLWDMEHHTCNGRPVSHGFQVSIGALSSAALYECALKTDFQELDIEHCVATWPSLEEQQQQVRETFSNTPYAEKCAEEVAAKYVDQKGLRKQLSCLKRKWPHIKEMLSRQLGNIDNMTQCLVMAGAPTTPEEIGFDRDELRESYKRAWMIRRRITILDLAVRTGLMNTWLDEIFGPGGRWDPQVVPVG